MALPICGFCQLSNPLSIAEIVPPALIPCGSGWTVNHVYCLVTVVAIDLSPANGVKLLHCSQRLAQAMGTWPKQGHLESLHMI